MIDGYSGNVRVRVRGNRESSGSRRRAPRAAPGKYALAGRPLSSDSDLGWGVNATGRAASRSSSRPSSCRAGGADASRCQVLPRAPDD